MIVICAILLFYFLSLNFFVIINNSNFAFRWFTKIDWVMLYNKHTVAPFIPTYTGPSDTHNFEEYVEEDATVVCNGIDQTYFADF